MRPVIAHSATPVSLNSDFFINLSAFGASGHALFSRDVQSNFMQIHPIGPCRRRKGFLDPVFRVGELFPQRGNDLAHAISEAGIRLGQIILDGIMQLALVEHNQLFVFFY